MPGIHVKDRLTERTSAAEADRAFEFLRDSRALAAYLDQLAQSDARLGAAERVALPLTAGRNPPHLVVTRQGKGVTCLGAGMAFSVPALTAAQVQAFLDERERTIRNRIALAQLKERPRTLRAVYDRALDMTRSEFEFLRAVAPLAQGRWASTMMDISQDITARANASERRGFFQTEEQAIAAWRLYSAAGLHAVAMEVVPETVAQLLFAARLREGYLSDRAQWTLTNHPEETLANLGKIIAGKNLRLGRGTLLPLAVIGHRFPWLRERALELFTRCVAPRNGSTLAGETAWFRAVVRDETLPLRGAVAALMMLFWRLAPPERALGSGEFGPTYARAVECLLAGERDLPALAEAMSPWHKDLVSRWQPLRDFHKEPLPHPAHLPAVPEAERVRIALWYTAAHALMPAVERDPLTLCLLWSAAPMDAFLPLHDDDEPAERHITLKEGADYMRNALPSYLREKMGSPKPRQHAQPAVGRNDPCSCGSGKKFKKCCGAAG